MIETVHANDGIDEQGFRYYARMERYANLSSDMKELDDIHFLPLFNRCRSAKNKEAKQDF